MTFPLFHFFVSDRGSTTVASSKRQAEGAGVETEDGLRETLEEMSLLLDDDEGTFGNSGLLRQTGLQTTHPQLPTRLKGSADRGDASLGLGKTHSSIGTEYENPRNSLSHIGRRSQSRLESFCL